MERKDKLIFSRCICGYRVLFDGTDAAMVRNDGSVRWEKKTDALPVGVLAEVDAFACKIARDACSDMTKTFDILVRNWKSDNAFHIFKRFPSAYASDRWCARIILAKNSPYTAGIWKEVEN